MKRLLSVLFFVTMLSSCNGHNGHLVDKPEGDPVPSCGRIVTHVTKLYDEAGAKNGGRRTTLNELKEACKKGRLSLDQKSCIVAAASLEGLGLCDGLRLQPVAPR